MARRKSRKTSSRGRSAHQRKFAACARKGKGKTAAGFRAHMKRCM